MPRGVAELVDLLSARGEALEALVADAGRLRDEGLRRAGRERVVTYSPKVFIPVTTLCRDRCHYCTFVDTPAKLATKGLSAYLSEEQVLAVAHQGAALGCREALLTLGDRPEDRWGVAREWLSEHGFASTVDYVGHLARRITAETGLLSHLNPGVLSLAELQALRPTAPSMGMMLETTSREIFERPGGAHFGSPDKDPEVRLAVLEDAGRARVPFTTGLLVGIGESLEDRAESLIALRDVHERHGHVQEVIIQNFRAKPATAMQDVDDAGADEYLATVATARLVLGADMRIQAPPNLSDPAELASLLAAGVDDWGGVSPLTADHVNPERPWPRLDDLERLTRESGFTLRQRLTVHQPYIDDRDRWIDSGLHDVVLAASATTASHRPRPVAAVRSPRAVAGDPVGRAAADPTGLTDADYAALLGARGDELDRLAALADDLRRSVVGATVSLVVNRNLGSDVCADPDLVERVATDAWDLGATEICIQGTAPGHAPDDVYEQLAAAAKRGAPDIHLHAFRPADVVDGARRTGRSLDEHLRALAAAGVDTVPGTGVKLLDEAYRARAFPGDLPVDRWLEAIRAAHGLGLRSTSVMFYGHGETPAQRVAHLRRLRALQAETGGFTEFVPMPLPGATVDQDDARAVHAVARLMLHGSINHHQAPWTRLGLEGAVAALRSGADDLGGTLLDGRVLPEAGVEFGRELPVETARQLARTLGRTLRLRTTTYAGTSAR
ncbi:bifunctional FO biosynthesis protein CofGH [Terrabacter aerolatus]|uniref:7,8-didemethyl-8-hydroxy-5-deazariboflavin synthase n=1 Tax=Terrabacter aerolatus TaxID=422442 RepID=A0A512D0F7_9MICO|nr:7,8-didemethyl-8-hydroxy-5-deazariboflavin synthase CofG [Terrabacter aerolatus]GEO29946.1 FO synthase [Terrabacter aerolatus]